MFRRKLHFRSTEDCKQRECNNMAAQKWKISEVNLVGKAVKQRAAEDKARADAWRAEREAELEAVIERDYSAMDVPEIKACFTRLCEAVAPHVEEFNALVAEHFEAVCSRPKLIISVTSGGFPPDERAKIRRDAAKHLTAKYRYMLANAQTFATEITNEATKHATDNPEVVEMLDRLAAPNRATPTLQPPGPAIGILRKLVPHPEEWGFEGYGAASSPLLPKPAAEPIKAIEAPKRNGK